MAISAIVNGRRPISVEMAWLLAQAFGATPEGKKVVFIDELSWMGTKGSAMSRQDILECYMIMGGVPTTTTTWASSRRAGSVHRCGVRTRRSRWEREAGIA